MYNSLRHKVLCRCGEYTLRSHVVENQTGLLYAPCIDCGYILDLKGDIGVVQSVVKISANGSKILANGIIILESKDIEAYLNGTLIFYNYGNGIVVS